MPVQTKIMSFKTYEGSEKPAAFDSFQMIKPFFNPTSTTEISTRDFDNTNFLNQYHKVYILYPPCITFFF